MLFVAGTAKEKGLVGSDYFAQHPTVPRANIVANVNFDMPILTYRFQTLVAFGAERSSIGPSVAKVAKAKSFTLTPDPIPEAASFVRTDHYSFVRTGRPPVSLEPGPAGPGKAAGEDFIQHHYPIRSPASIFSRSKPAGPVFNSTFWTTPQRYMR